MNLLVLILLLLLITGGLPQVGLHQYGYGPSVSLGTVLLIVLILMLFGRL